MKSDKPFITVIVPIYNGSKFLHSCLNAIFASNYDSFEVIVVDDCSTDDSAQISRSMGARVLSTSKNSGPGAARNLAAESARGEILFFVDVDVVIESETIGLVADRFNRQPEISALFGSYDDKPAETNFLSQYKNLQHHFVHQNSNSDASTFWAGLGALRRDVFLALGGFDCKKFAAPMIEDIDLGFRLREEGHQILLDPSIQAKHLKKWEVVGHLRTEILCRALPWSRLILENQGMINDMNLKTSDRLSAVLLALSIVIVPFLYWQPILILAVLLLLVAIAFLNWKILRFFADKKGLVFAAMTFPWQLLYFFYSGAVFAFCWMSFSLSRIFGHGKQAPAGR